MLKIDSQRMSFNEGQQGGLNLGLNFLWYLVLDVGQVYKQLMLSSFRI